MAVGLPMAARLLILGAIAPAAVAVLPSWGKSFLEVRSSGAQAASSKSMWASISLALADAELSSSGLATQMRIARSTGGPSTLKEYCAGPNAGGADAPHFEEGEQVNGNWHHLGTMYPGTVDHVNEDGTVNIKYDDGFVEEHVAANQFEEVEDTEEQKAQKKASKPQDDPACELDEFVDETKKGTEEAFGDVSLWLKNGGDADSEEGAEKQANQEEEKKAEIKRKAEEEKEKEKAADDKAQAKGAVFDKATDDSSAQEKKASEMEQLKQALADADAEIGDLQLQVDDSDRQLQQLDDGVEDDAVGNKTAVDTLIDRYKKRLGRRQREIQRLKDMLRDKQRDLDMARASAPSLAEIVEKVNDISKNCDKAKLRMANLEKDGELDPELKSSLENVFKQVEKLQLQMTALLAAQEQAQKANAKLSASLNGTNATNATGSMEDLEAEEARLALIAAAQATADDLRGVSAVTNQLDTGVHPHGAKWWRYRYEHSYVEALLMIFVTFIIMIWERLYTYIREHFWDAAVVERLSLLAHGTMYIKWLEYFSGQMMVCLLSFITVWVLSKFTHVFETLPYYLGDSEHMHLPHTSEEYRVIAIDICVILFVTVIMYFGLVFAVCHQTTIKLDEWARIERNHEDKTPRAGAVVVAAAAEYVAMKNYFFAQMETDDNRARFEKVLKNAKDVKHDLKNPKATFQLWVYLRLSVRHTVDHLYRFGWLQWLSIVLTFCVFCSLHRFAHMGYVRIMSFYGVASLILVIAMVFWIQKVKGFAKSEEAQSGKPTAAAAAFCSKYNTEVWVMMILHYLFFFNCYGVARMICQPWMWELHFKPVLCLTIFSVLLAIGFVFFVAPMIPSFACALAFPPYCDDENWDQLEDAAEEDKSAEAEYMKEPAPMSPKLSRSGTLTAGNL